MEKHHPKVREGLWDLVWWMPHDVNFSPQIALIFNFFLCQFVKSVLSLRRIRG